MPGNIQVTPSAEAPPSQSPHGAALVAASDVDAMRRAVEAALDARMRGIESSLERLQPFAEGFGQSNPFTRERPAAPSANAPIVPAKAAVPVEVASVERPRVMRAPREGSAPILGPVAFTQRTERILLAWAVSIHADVGRQGLPEALACLESLGWIDQDVRVRLARLGAGLASPPGAVRNDGRMAAATFERSLGFVAELQGMG